VVILDGSWPVSSSYQSIAWLRPAEIVT